VSFIPHSVKSVGSHMHRNLLSRFTLSSNCVLEPPVPRARLIADALRVPLAYLYCEDDKVATLLLALHKLKPGARDRKVAELLNQIR
jgi:hypothetical protein